MGLLEESNLGTSKAKCSLSMVLASYVMKLKRANLEYRVKLYMDINLYLLVNGKHEATILAQRALIVLNRKKKNSSFSACIYQ